MLLHFGTLDLLISPPLSITWHFLFCIPGSLLFHTVADYMDQTSGAIPQLQHQLNRSSVPSLTKSTWENIDEHKEHTKSLNRMEEQWGGNIIGINITTKYRNFK